MRESKTPSLYICNHCKDENLPFLFRIDKEENFHLCQECYSKFLQQSKALVLSFMKDKE